MDLPKLFIERTKEILSKDSELLLSALETSPPISVRMNNKIEFEYLFDNTETRKIDWCEDAYYLAKRPLFTADPLFHAGAYYVQEASSMFLSQVVQKFLQESEIGIDLCAAPGGKSTLLKQFLPNESLLISNEIVRSRALILAENLIKWGEPNIIVTNNDSKAFSDLHSMFDFVVADVPCSGEGMFRKDPNTINEWSIQNVQICSERQKTIIENCWPSLKDDGILIYSTCTYNKEENEDNIEWICQELGASVLKIDTSHFPGISETEYGYRFYPHKITGEGFFISILRKTAENSRKIKIKTKLGKTSKMILSKTLPFKLGEDSSFVYLESDTHIKAYSKKWLEHHLYLENELNCFESGIEIAEKKGKDLIPSHQLAMSKLIDKNNYNYVDLNYEQAISYLRKESINLYDQKIGYLLVGYKGIPIGWVKNLGNRSNNLYPSHWKIKMNI